MFVAMFLALPIILSGEIQASKAYSYIESGVLAQNSVTEALSEYRKSIKTFGILSGSFFMIIGIAMLVMFYLLFVLIKAGEKLSDGL
jgi:hypothetical protein